MDHHHPSPNEWLVNCALLITLSALQLKAGGMQQCFGWAMCTCAWRGSEWWDVCGQGVCSATQVRAKSYLSTHNYKLIYSPGNWLLVYGGSRLVQTWDPLSEIASITWWIIDILIASMVYPLCPVLHWFSLQLWRLILSAISLFGRESFALANAGDIAPFCEWAAEPTAYKAHSF